MDYRQQLIDRLACELFKCNDNPDKDMFLRLVNEGNLLRYTKEILTFRKGIQLVASMLFYFPLVGCFCLLIWIYFVYCIIYLLKCDA